MAKDEDLARAYAGAKLRQTEVMADEMLAIADDGRNDSYVDPKTGRTMTDTDVLGRSRLRVDTRKWLMAKLQPKTYGDQAQFRVTGDDGGPVRFIDQAALAKLTDDELAVYVAAMEKLGFTAPEGEGDAP
jgi:hypothetical protein